MESRFKPALDHLSLSLSLYHSAISAGLKWEGEDDNTRRVWRAAITFLDLWPCRQPTAFRDAAIDTLKPSVSLAWVIVFWDKRRTVRTNTEYMQRLRALSPLCRSPAYSYSPSPPFLTSYSLFSCLPPSFFLSECLNGSPRQAEPQSGLCEGGERQLWSRGKWLLWGLTPALCEGPGSSPHLKFVHTPTSKHIHRLTHTHTLVPLHIVSFLWWRVKYTHTYAHA